MEALLLRVGLLGFDPSQVRLSGRVRRSSYVDCCRAYATARFGVRFFRSIQGFNEDECGSRTLVLRDTCTKTTSRLLFPDCHRQGQAGSGVGTATATHWRLVLAAVMIVRLSMDVDVIFIMFWVFCTSSESL